MLLNGRENAAASSNEAQVGKNHCFPHTTVTSVT